MNNRIELLRKELSDNEYVLISSYPNIFYYSSFTSEDAYLLISCDKSIIITDSRYTVQAKEQCPEFDIADITNGFDCFFGKNPDIRVLYEEKCMSVASYINFKKKYPKVTFEPASEKISKHRSIKDSGETEKIKQAEELGDLAFSHILKFIKPGMTEIEIATELEHFMRKNGASKLSFDSIVASGVRSSMPHGVASKKVVERGEILTLDFGCVLDGYCSDMTRTIALGSIGDKEREIYNIVLSAQATVLSEIKVGMKCSDIDKLARDVISAAGYGEYFGHSLGHSVGIEIHETPCFSPKSKDIFENGHVITVEPGIYIEGLGGVRIEDVVTSIDGNLVNLTKSPKELIIL